MRTILIVDGAENGAYDCFLASDELYDAIFPGDGQDVEFIEDFIVRYPSGTYDKAFDEMWLRRIPKREIRGIDGTLFYEMEFKRSYYPNKRESDLDRTGRAQEK